MEIVNRLHGDQLNNKDTSNSSLQQFKTLKGKKLFGGGGITPDQHIPIDSTLFDSSLNKLYEKNSIGNFSYRYYIAHKVELSKYKTVEEFENGLKIDDSIIKELQQFAASNNVTINLRSKSAIEFAKTRIKALIARIAYGESGYFYILNNNEPIFKAAMKELI
jgi:carboxyl-terminal processing protease